MRKPLVVIGVVVVVLAALGVLAYTNLELVPVTQSLPASREARSNSFLALERWLAATGHTVEVASWANAKRVEDVKTVLVEEPSRFLWDEDAWETLEPWLTAGGSLIVPVEDDGDIQSGLRRVLEQWGIRWEEDDSAEDELDSTEAPAQAAEEEKEEEEFDGWVSFVPTAEDGRFPDGLITRGGADGVTRLVTIPLGKGAITVTGWVAFLTNRNIGEAPNARLAWELLGSREGAVLFVRYEEGDRDFWGNLARRGDLIPLGVSLAALLALGFWMLIPGFGVARDETPLPGKPIRERFLAEARFLDKHRALEAAYFPAYTQKNQRGDTESPELEELKKALKRKPKQERKQSRKEKKGEKNEL